MGLIDLRIGIYCLADLGEIKTGYVFWMWLGEVIILFILFLFS